MNTPQPKNRDFQPLMFQKMTEGERLDYLQFCFAPHSIRIEPYYINGHLKCAYHIVEMDLIIFDTYRFEKLHLKTCTQVEYRQLLDWWAENVIDGPDLRIVPFQKLTREKYKGGQRA
jgi:hypothetical protein